MTTITITQHVDGDDEVTEVTVDDDASPTELLGMIRIAETVILRETASA